MPGSYFSSGLKTLFNFCQTDGGFTNLYGITFQCRLWMRPFALGSLILSWREPPLQSSMGISSCNMVHIGGTACGPLVWTSKILTSPHSAGCWSVLLLRSQQTL